MHISFAETPGLTKPLNSGENQSLKASIAITAKIHIPIYPASFETVLPNEPPIPVKSDGIMMPSITAIYGHFSHNEWFLGFLFIADFSYDEILKACNNFALS